jgi:hypothetical protein
MAARLSCAVCGVHGIDACSTLIAPFFVLRRCASAW